VAAITRIEPGKADGKGDNFTLIADLDKQLVTGDPYIDIDRIGKHQFHLHFVNISAALELDGRFIVNDIGRIIFAVNIESETLQGTETDNLLLVHPQLLDR